MNFHVSYVLYKNKLQVGSFLFFTLFLSHLCVSRPTFYQLLFIWWRRVWTSFKHISFCERLMVNKCWPIFHFHVTLLWFDEWCVWCRVWGKEWGSESHMLEEKGRLGPQAELDRQSLPGWVRYGWHRYCDSGQWCTVKGRRAAGQEWMN